jgi:hypothetical protein
LLLLLVLLVLLLMLLVLAIRCSCSASSHVGAQLRASRSGCHDMMNLHCSLTLSRRSCPRLEKAVGAVLAVVLVQVYFVVAAMMERSSRKIKYVKSD